MPTGGHGPRYGTTVSPEDNAEERVSNDHKQECVLLTRVDWWSYRSGKHGTLRKYRHQDSFFFYSFCSFKKNQDSFTTHSTF
jgi:hypothetical protein